MQELDVAPSDLSFQECGQLYRLTSKCFGAIWPRRGRARDGKSCTEEMRLAHHAIPLAAYLKKGKKNVTSWQGGGGMPFVNKI